MGRLMTRREADELLQLEDQYQESLAECRAEAGMGAVSMGFDGYNGVAEFNATLPERDPAELAELREAQAVAEMFHGLTMYAVGEFPPAAPYPRVPEFRAPTPDLPF